MFTPTCLTQSSIEGAQRSCFEFKLAQYTTTAILVALEIASLLCTMFMLVMVHREFDSVLAMYVYWRYSNEHHLL